MIQKEVTLTNPLGMHTRTSAALVVCANRFVSKIELHARGKVIDVRRILAVMSSGLVCGDVVTLVVSGDDEEAAMQALLTLFSETFQAIG